MAQGVPGLPPPPKLLDALGKCASDPRSYGYCPTVGESMLREALAKEMKAVYGQESDIALEDVTITAGCNMAFSAAIMAVAEAGDGVILPVPWSVLGLLGLFHTDKRRTKVFQSRVSWKPK